MTRKKELTFAEARERLLQILHDVESDAGDVDKLVAQVKEAAELYRFCNDRLAAARTQVTQVVADLAAAEQGLAQGAEADSDEDGDADEADPDEAEVETVREEDEGEGGRQARRGSGGRLPF